MNNFLVTLTFQATGITEPDSSLNSYVQADNYQHALQLAKRNLSVQHKKFNFLKIWCWSVERKAKYSAPRRDTFSCFAK